MIAIIDQKRREVAELCRRFHVRRLELFGSAAGDRFDLHRSDLDFLVEFDHRSWVGAADRYFGFREGLEDLFQRQIDLVELPAIHNPYFLRGIEPSRTVLYAA